MPIEVIYEDRPSQAVSAMAEGENLWLSSADLAKVSGWELKPEGVCKGDVCVPIPPGRESEFLGRKDTVNLSMFARLLGQPAAHDDAHSVWFFGESVARRHDDLLSGIAPDFSLPDLDGKMHSLSDYAGRKVLLLSWASW